VTGLAIEDNVLFVSIEFPGSDKNIIRNNYIGTTADGTAPLPNGKRGMMIDNYSDKNIIGPGNLIAYSTGDGIRMVIDVGAELWHMNGIEWGTHGFKAPDLPTAHWLQPKAQSWINVNRTGRRFRDESVDYGHAKKRLEIFNFDVANIAGYAIWPNSPWYIVFDEKVRQAGPIVLTERRTGSPPFITYIESHEIYKWSKDNSVEIGKQ